MVLTDKTCGEEVDGVVRSDVLIDPIFLERYDTVLLQKILDLTLAYYQSVYTDEASLKRQWH